MYSQCDSGHSGDPSLLCRGPPYGLPASLSGSGCLCALYVAAACQGELRCGPVTVAAGLALAARCGLLTILTLRVRA